MTELFGLIAVGAITFLLSLLLPFAVKPLLTKLGIMDVPNERSSHERPVLRGLGLAVLIAMAVGGILSVFLPLLFGHPAVSTNTITVVAGSIAAGLLGLSEDLRGLSVKVRSLCLLLIASGVAVSLLWQPQLFGGSSGLVSPVVLQWVNGWVFIQPPVWALVLLAVYAVLFISSYINVANFMDGLNGISGFHGVIAGLAFAVAGFVTGHGWLLLVGLVLAAGFAGFLPWNLTKPGAFLGDVGSYLLGGAVAVTSFAALVAGVPFLATIGPMVIYFGDVGVTLVKRVRAGKRWDEPHKEHAYQRIQQLGYTHVQASAITAGCTAIASLLGIASLFTGLWGTLALLVAGLAVVVFYSLLPNLLPARPNA